MIVPSIRQRTEATISQEQLEVTAAGLQKLLVLFYEAFHSTPGHFKHWSNQTSSGLFLYLPRRNSSAMAFTPWGEMDWGYIPRETAAFQEVFAQLNCEQVLHPGDGTAAHGLRGSLYALRSVRGHELPSSILTQEDHALEAQATQRSFNEHFPDYPECLPINW